jgi:hypothetical protein
LVQAQFTVCKLSFYVFLLLPLYTIVAISLFVIGCSSNSVLAVLASKVWLGLLVVVLLLQLHFFDGLRFHRLSTVIHPPFEALATIACLFHERLAMVKTAFSNACVVTTTKTFDNFRQIIFVLSPFALLFALNSSNA